MGKDGEKKKGDSLSTLKKIAKIVARELKETDRPPKLSKKAKVSKTAKTHKGKKPAKRERYMLISSVKCKGAKGKSNVVFDE